MSVPVRRPRDRWSPEEVERGLVAVALAGGNTRRAARELKAQGLSVPRTTLESWANSLHVDRYEKIRVDVLPRLHARMAAESEQLAQRYAEAEGETLERFYEELPNLKAAEVAGALRNLSTSRGISLDKSLLLRGRPNVIVEFEDPMEIARNLARMRPDVFECVEEDVELVTDADVVDAEPGALPAGQPTV